MWGTIELFLALIAAKIKPAAPSASMWITSMGIPIASWSSSPSKIAAAIGYAYAKGSPKSCYRAFIQTIHRA